MKMTFSSDKIYYNFSQENPKITNIYNPHRRYTHFNQIFFIFLNLVPILFQVFPPLRLDPRYIILIPGATFQLRATGGPYPQVTTLFSINNETVASVDSVGLIEARVPGKSLVTGAVEATDPQSGHTIVFSKVIDIVNEKLFLVTFKMPMKWTLSFILFERTCKIVMNSPRILLLETSLVTL